MDYIGNNVSGLVMQSSKAIHIYTKCFSERISNRKSNYTLLLPFLARPGGPQRHLGTLWSSGACAAADRSNAASGACCSALQVRPSDSGPILFWPVTPFHGLNIFATPTWTYGAQKAFVVLIFFRHQHLPDIHINVKLNLIPLRYYTPKWLVGVWSWLWTNRHSVCIYRPSSSDCH